MLFSFHDKIIKPMSHKISPEMHLEFASHDPRCKRQKYEEKKTQYGNIILYLSAQRLHVFES